ncbi:hypothetical protein LEM8419_01765 [Neolewinella maritima]|uniref:DUF1593 domain-containing protein n=1 Tax=Neolewinella maritima TaxID=1383882 RepID=A0ABM9B1C9_9BACT|nr:DUF1593 domain-containing protein [Neolewinella maritima]CAH1000631.1 hypothetical protein LEM8419_01765 [Neolewinella maritima]
MNYLYIACLLLAFTFPLRGQFAAQERPRTVITTDGEIDDVDSFVRLLLYANEMQIEGLVYSSSMWHYKGDGQGTTMTSAMDMTRELYGQRSELRWPGEQWMQELIAAYGEVYPVLSTHADGYPAPDSLLALVKVGNITFEGEMEEDTEGSDFIRDLLLDGDSTQLYLQAWGGTNTIARALKSIEDRYAGTPAWPEVYRGVCAKAVLYLIMDQDATYRDYIAGTWADIPVLYNTGQFGALAYNWKKVVPEELRHWLEGSFMRTHVVEAHGPLTAAYYSYGDGKQQAGDPEHIHGDSTRLDSAQWGSFRPYDFISEGDSPAFLHLVDVGLDQLAHPDWGGWGGRLVRSDSVAGRWEDAVDYNSYSGRSDRQYALVRWLPALQRDLAARADWCVYSYEAANHPPSVRIDGEDRLTVTPGEKLVLRATATDPDGDALYYHWWQYGEVDTYPGEAMIILDGPELRVDVPRDLESGQTIHFIVSVTDGGAVPLTRYTRVVLTGA